VYNCVRERAEVTITTAGGGGQSINRPPGRPHTADTHARLRPHTTMLGIVLSSQRAAFPGRTNRLSTHTHVDPEREKERAPCCLNSSSSTSGSLKLEKDDDVNGANLNKGLRLHPL
jgi:hypothetical protein